ncbi:hypothetical protein GCM10009592_30140 [Brachybacterium rhamnosum]
MSVPNLRSSSSTLHESIRAARRGRRRPARAHEAAAWRVAQALVAIEAERASTPQAWVAAVLEHPDFAAARTDTRRALEAIAQVLAGASEPGSLLVRRLTWEAMAERLECTTRTVARLLRKLHQARLLGRVAAGRSARFAPPTKDGEQHADSAVYVLAVPAPAVDSGDEDVTPPHPQVSSNNPSHASACSAREAAAREAVEAARVSGRRLSGGADRRMIEALPAAHRDPFWDVRRVPETRVEMLAAAAEMRRRSFVLRRASLRAVRSLGRDFWENGWTVADVLRALDQRPDGTSWPHSGAHGVRSVRAWSMHRLRRWRSAAGCPLPSLEERRRAHREAVLVEQERARQERLEARQRAQENPITPTTRQLLQEAREVARGAATRLRHSHPAAA